MVFDLSATKTKVLEVIKNEDAWSVLILQCFYFVLFLNDGGKTCVVLWATLIQRARGIGERSISVLVYNGHWFFITKRKRKDCAKYKQWVLYIFFEGMLSSAIIIWRSCKLPITENSKRIESCRVEVITTRKWEKWKSFHVLS